MAGGNKGKIPNSLKNRRETGIFAGEEVEIKDRTIEPTVRW